MCYCFHYNYNYREVTTYSYCNVLLFPLYNYREVTTYSYCNVLLLPLYNYREVTTYSYCNVLYTVSTAKRVKGNARPHVRGSEMTPTLLLHLLFIIANYYRAYNKI